MLNHGPKYIHIPIKKKKPCKINYRASSRLEFD